jgi:hypothetical protein
MVALPQRRAVFNPKGVAIDRVEISTLLALPSARVRKVNRTDHRHPVRDGGPSFLAMGAQPRAQALTRRASPVTQRATSYIADYSSSESARFPFRSAPDDEAESPCV